MVEKNEVQKERLEKIFKKVKAVYGSVVPQMEFLGHIEADYLEEFLTQAVRILKHPHIDPDLFAFIRLHIAFKEEYPYCKAFNTKLLLGKKYSQSQIDKTITNIKNVPFDEKHQALAVFALKAVYKSRACIRKDFNSLYAMGWTQRDVFDVVDHAGTLLKNGRILTAYSIKE